MTETKVAPLILFTDYFRLLHVEPQDVDNTLFLYLSFV